MKTNEHPSECYSSIEYMRRQNLLSIKNNINQIIDSYFQIIDRSTIDEMVNTYYDKIESNDSNDDIDSQLRYAIVELFDLSILIDKQLHKSEHIIPTL